MKRILILVLLLSGLCFAQSTGVRFGDGEPVISYQTIPGFSLPFVNAVASPTINFCSTPVVSAPCLNKATTYTDASLQTPCPTNQQVVLEGTTNCVATGDSNGHWGVWAAAGQYQYTVTVAGGQSFGPFYATLGGSSSGGGGSPTIIPGVSNDILASTGDGTTIKVDTGKITINPSTHFINAWGYNGIGTAPFNLTGLPSSIPCTAGPGGMIQFAFCPGPLATLSYNGDGPFPIQRYGLIGSTLQQLPASSYIPLDANNCLPLGAQGDAGWLRVNPGVMGLVNCASLTGATRLNMYGGTNGFGTNGQFVSLNYSAGFAAFQVVTDRNGTGGFLPLMLCTQGSASCGGWMITAGATPGILFPVSQNTNADIGSPGNGQLRNLFIQGALVNSGQYVVGYTNDATGTQIGQLAKRSSVTDSNGNLEATLATTADTVGLYGIVVGESAGGTCGVGANCTTGIAYVAYKGHTTAAFDGSTTLKHWAIASVSTAANLADSGIACTAQPPRNVDVLGCIQATNVGAGTYAIDLNFLPADIGGIFNCGATVACANTLTTSAKTVYGRVALSSGTPSTAVLTGLTFTSSSTYQCVAINGTTATNTLKVTYSSGSSATFTGPNTITDSVSYICTGS